MIERLEPRLGAGVVSLSETRAGVITRLTKG